ncbi:SgcJ/EcaC family oxidoreductase [Pseudotabrizicola algicola]|uniref:SgcJ/EcaC family oxidoreductase n=1 Tax=Pseudotabrizicola algicola TaxID=2709381 RepID=A0A6B3RVB2_9RHOB|nr:SgcJ/EcaC family oxidoreductase [Pseudotabrizicola algicola]NEX47805.1 SgcJ/EcaC family oxidoreductase [Pseudotabrizicola algicola]
MTAANDFPRAFAQAFGSQSAEALAALFAEDGSFHMLTGHWAEGRSQIAKGMQMEFAGLSRMARLVTGKTALRPLGPGAAVLHQRFVVTGLRDASGGELPRIAALLTAVLAAKGEGWLALTATFAMVEG